jgi:hypothetical protein
MGRCCPRRNNWQSYWEISQRQNKKALKKISE